ncbi:hypothetical protein [Leptospira andrefontaineae]|uniref:Uncharacterized protein n=1 Tax=Leptospira andrefontaineae TaxID=2484976 RepID=A0A4R9H6X7_9LEPT|nr:hypothetical protein [Leptospira andrefontaineae]TGK41215.1 hypothetical protein EHO65_07225 [Leptospira andrefontaineae]
MNSTTQKGTASHAGLIAKKIPDSLGRNITHWVKPGQDIHSPREKKIQQAKQERNRIQHNVKKDPKVEAQIKEMTDRHLQFEKEAREQRRSYGSSPKFPKPGMIMRVYATGKVNVGGMLARVKEIAADGKTIICEFTSGKFYSLPIDHLEFAKSEISHPII